MDHFLDHYIKGDSPHLQPYGELPPGSSLFPHLDEPFMLKNLLTPKIQEEIREGILTRSEREEVSS